jgi:hypothetical protein
VTISQTWSDVAQTFKALVVNAAGTSAANSAAASNLLELQLGGVNQLSVTKTGGIRFSATNSILLTVGGSSITIGGPSGNVYLGDSSVFGASCLVGTAGTFFQSSLPFGWSSNSTSYGTPDTILVRDAANTLALRNGAAAQTFNVYGTYTSGASYERLTLSAPSAANAIIGTNKGSGGGTARGLELQTDGVTKLSISGSAPFLGTFGSASNAQWLELSANAGTTLQYNSTHKIYFSSTVCEITANNTTITTGLVRFSGATSSFPALKRSTIYLQARLADDSAFAPIQGKLTTDTAYTGTTVVPTGFITLYDSTGTAYKVPCVAA